jgi:hypothetical protein
MEDKYDITGRKQEKEESVMDIEELYSCHLQKLISEFLKQIMIVVFCVMTCNCIEGCRRVGGTSCYKEGHSLA